MTNEPENMKEKNVEAEGAQAKPRKKKPMLLFRPENSKNSAVRKLPRPGAEKKSTEKRRPAPGAAAPERKKTTAAAPVRPAAESINENTAAAAETVSKAAPEKAVSEAAVSAAAVSAAAAAPAAAGVSTAPAPVKEIQEAPKPVEVPETAASVPAPENKPAETEKTDAEKAKPAASVSEETTVKTPAAREQRKVETERPVRREQRTERTERSSAARPEGSRPARGTSRTEGTGRAAGRDGAGRGTGTDSRGRAAASGRPGQGGQARGQAGPGRGFAGRPQPASRGGASRGGADAKPFEKEGRGRNDRGGRNDRSRKNDRGDKFDRMEQAHTQGGKNTSRPKPGTKPKAPAPVEEKIKSIVLPEVLTIKDLADKLKIQPAAIVKKLFMQGKMVTVNEEIDFDTAEEIAIDYDVICEKEVKVDVLEELLKEVDDAPETLKPRPPVVCVMGHVDHGKTSLLDAIRNTHVIDREAGGITQHIGASVVTCNGQKITFLDTPGHEAFTAMRMRGANSTDIAILVVAADDGVMPQTVEAINHARAAGIEIIVAINKIDKPGANIDRVKQELTEYELLAEDWGGSTVCVPVSAKTHEGIDNLLEMILLTAEVLELKANPDRRARGLVIEAQLDKGRGPVATILVQKGTLHVGDPVAAGPCYGRVRAMIDDKGRQVKEAGPSMPVEILGFSDVPGAGEIMVSPETEKEARSFAETFISEGRERMLEETKAKMSLDDLFSQIQAGSLKELNLIVKADVQGSVEAVKQSLVKLSNDEVVVKVIHSGVGLINESDVILASASGAIIIGFNTRPDPVAKATAETEGVDIRLYRVIYDAINDVESAMKGMLDPVFEEKVIGHAEIRQLFRASGIGTIGGAYVLDGTFQRGCNTRITRDGKQIFEGPLASLKRFKDDVKEVRAGYECGLVFEKFNDLAELDQVEAYIMVEVPR